jgi:uncharacterized protein YegL
MTIRRLPVYLLLDTSGSMHGEPIESVNIGLRAMLSTLRQNAYARESVFLCIVTFDSKINEVLPLTALDNITLPEIVCPPSGGTFLGEGLQDICERVARDFKKPSGADEGDWKPLLFIMTDGKPSDTMVYEEMIPRVKAMPFAAVIACAAGPKSVPDQLKQLTDNVVSLDTMDSSTFSTFFKWVSDTVTAGNDGATASSSSAKELPPPPPEVQIVL